MADLQNKYLDLTGLGQFLNKLDGRYLQSETDTLATVTARGATTDSNITLNGTTTLTGTVYLNAETPFLINNNREGRIGMRAANSSNINLAQVNVAPASAFDAQKYSGYVWQMSASGVTNSQGTGTGESRASLRVSTYGLEFNKDGSSFEDVAMVSDLPQVKRYI